MAVGIRSPASAPGRPLHPVVRRPHAVVRFPNPVPARSTRPALVMPSWRKLVVQRSIDPSRSRSSSVSWRQRPWPSSRPRRPINRAPQSTPSIGAPVRRSALVTRSRPSSSTTAPQAESRGRLSSGASKGSSSTVRPRGRANSPARVASMAEAGRVHLHCACSAPVMPCLKSWGCPPGGIGRRAGFRFQWLRSWGFKSPGGHSAGGGATGRQLPGIERFRPALGGFHPLLP